jgi:sugar phosphate isomerase/epimerase
VVAIGKEMAGVSGPTWKLTGFGDEIDDDPDLQCVVMQALGASHIDLRSAWGTNVLSFDDEQIVHLRECLNQRGIRVSAIASPIGKIDIDQPVAASLASLERAIALARIFETPYIRIFSFYRSPHRSAEEIRDAVLERMAALVRRVEREGMTLVHENEKEIYGDTPERVRDLIESIGSERLRVVWDPANFVQVGVRPLSEGYATLAPFIDYVHVKDALLATGAVTPAGEGDGEWTKTVAALVQANYTGFVSLEPHLSTVGNAGGIPSAATFGIAARAFRRLAEQAGVTLQ